MRGLLNKLDIEIVKGPSSVGVYRVAPVREDADVEQLAARLRDAGHIVTFVATE